MKAKEEEGKENIGRRNDEKIKTKSKKTKNGGKPANEKRRRHQGIGGRKAGGG
jgi:hypothetical protein